MILFFNQIERHMPFTGIYPFERDKKRRSPFLVGSPFLIPITLKDTHISLYSSGIIVNKPFSWYSFPSFLAE